MDDCGHSLDFVSQNSVLTNVMQTIKKRKTDDNIYTRTINQINTILEHYLKERLNETL